MSIYSKFRCVGAVITDIVSYDTCMVAAILEASQKLDLSDKSRWIKVEMGRTPKKASTLADAWFDDRGEDATGKDTPTKLSPVELEHFGITSIGPLADLPRGQYLGAVYLRDFLFSKSWDKIKDPKLDPDPARPEFPWKPKNACNYELTSVVAEDGNPPPYARYHGVHGKVTAINGSVRTLDILSMYDRTRVAAFDVDFKDAKHCVLDVPPDPVDLLVPGGPKELMLSANAAVGDVGGIFIRLAHAASNAFRGPKVPPGFGY